MSGDPTRELYDRASSVLVGDVNSSVRGKPYPYPEFVERAEGGEGR